MATVVKGKPYDITSMYMNSDKGSDDQDQLLQKLNSDVVMLNSCKARLDETVAKVALVGRLLVTFKAEVNFGFVKATGSKEIADVSENFKGRLIDLIKIIKKMNIFKDLLAETDPIYKDLQASAKKSKAELGNCLALLTEHTSGFTLNYEQFAAFIDGLKIELLGSEIPEDDRLGFIATADAVQRKVADALAIIKDQYKRIYVDSEKSTNPL